MLSWFEDALVAESPRASMNTDNGKEGSSSLLTESSSMLRKILNGAFDSECQIPSVELCLIMFGPTQHAVILIRSQQNSRKQRRGAGLVLKRATRNLSEECNGLKNIHFSCCTLFDPVWTGRGCSDPDPAPESEYYVAHKGRGSQTKAEGC